MNSKHDLPWQDLPGPEKHITLTQEDYNKDEVVSNLLESDVELLKHIHAEQYSGTDDAMSDDFENWILSLTSTELKELLK